MSTRFGGNTDSIVVKLKNGGVLTVNPMLDNARAIDLAADLVASMGEGAMEAFGAITNAVSAGVALGKGISPNARILDGAALGSGLAKVLRAVTEKGGAAYMREWMAGGAVYTHPGGRQQFDLTDEAAFSDRVNVPPDVIFLAFKLAMVANTRDFFGTCSEELIGAPVMALKDKLVAGLELLDKVASGQEVTGALEQLAESLKKPSKTTE